MYLVESQEDPCFEIIELDNELDTCRSNAAAIYITATAPDDIRKSYRDRVHIVKVRGGVRGTLLRAVRHVRELYSRTIILDNCDAPSVRTNSLAPLLFARAGLFTRQNNIQPADILPVFHQLLNMKNLQSTEDNILVEKVRQYSDVEDPKNRILQTLNDTIITAGGGVHASDVEHKNELIGRLAKLPGLRDHFTIWNAMQKDGIIICCIAPEVFRKLTETVLPGQIPFSPDTRSDKRNDHPVMDEFRKHATQAEKNIIRSFIRGEEKEIGMLWAQIWNASKTNHNVIIRGESGTGKELAAQCIHELLRRRAHNPRTGILRSVNTAAVPLEMFDSEFFGLKRAAGLNAEHPGHFVIANGGTLFLDEIGDLRLKHQAKLLRAIEERAVIPIGANAPIELDIKLICATHKNLEALIRKKKVPRRSLSTAGRSDGIHPPT